MWWRNTMKVACYKCFKYIVPSLTRASRQLWHTAARCSFANQMCIPLELIYYASTFCYTGSIVQVYQQELFWWGLGPNQGYHATRKTLWFLQETNCSFQVAGALFVYQREAAPKYGFLIMNRNSKENMVEVVTTELTFQVDISEHYLMRGDIKIWGHVER